MSTPNSINPLKSVNSSLDDYLTDIDVFREIRDSELRRLELERQELNKQIRLSIADTVCDLLANLLGDDRSMLEWLSAYLYWQVPDIPVGWIEQLVPVGSAMMHARNHQLHGIVCNECSSVLEIPSRAQLAYYSGTKAFERVCDNCRNKRWAEAGQRESTRREEIRARIIDLKTMKYAEYLQTPEWQAVRTRKLKRANFRCELCNTTGKLHVHHKTYERRGEEQDRDLIVLCANCHAKFHDKLPEGE